MTENKLREILCGGGSSICTRISSRWGLITELAAYGGCYDYIEYLADSRSGYDSVQPLRLLHELRSQRRGARLD